VRAFLEDVLCHRQRGEDVGSADVEGQVREDLLGPGLRQAVIHRPEWQMPQKRISICTSCSAGSRRGIVVEASGDVSPAAEYAFDLYMQ
jgi:hypothetical protein